MVKKKYKAKTNLGETVHKCVSLLERETEVEQLRLLVQMPESKRGPGARTPVFDRKRSRCGSKLHRGW